MGWRLPSGLLSDRIGQVSARYSGDETAPEDWGLEQIPGSIEKMLGLDSDRTQVAKKQ
jgi:hypothetical protein